MPMQQVHVMARRFNRSVAPERLDANTARVLQRCDPSRLGGGRVVRGPGCARTQAGPSASTITALFPGRERTGDYLSIFAASGVVYVVPGNGQTADGAYSTTPTNAPRNEWSDAPQREDDGQDQALFSITAGMTWATQPGDPDSSPGQWGMAAYRVTGSTVAPVAFPAVNYSAPWVGAAFQGTPNIGGAGVPCLGFTPQHSGLNSGPNKSFIAGNGGSTAFRIFGTGNAGYWYFGYYKNSTGPLDNTTNIGITCTITAKRKCTVYDAATLVTTTLNAGQSLVTNDLQCWYSIQPA